MNQRAINHIAVLNRGEAASRFLRGLADYNLLRGTAIAHSVVFTDPDAKAPFVRRAAHAIALGPAVQADASGRLRSAYLDVPRIIELLQRNGCDAVWPGWGFLSEDAAFVQTLHDVGMVFLGPSAQAMQRLGDKYAAKQLAQQAAVPLAPWRLAGEASDAELLVLAEQVGYPLMVKASAGGGGRGIRKVTQAADLVAAVQVVRSEVARIFGAGTVLLERCIEGGRHVEVQVVAGADGIAVGLGVRDCSIQRRHQKIIEEAPSPVISQALRERMAEAAVRLAARVGYVNAGTVEFILDLDTLDFYFLEVNTRIQVEHPVTEMVTGVDLVAEQIRVAGGAPLSITQGGIVLSGHAIECRINAENARQDFMPSPGRLVQWQAPTGEGVRVDSHCFPGYFIPPFYDSMIAKLIVHGRDRAAAVERMSVALKHFRVEGIATTIPFHQAVLAHPDFLKNRVTTRWVEEIFMPGAYPAESLA